MKLFERPLVGYLTRPQIEAVLGSPTDTTWLARRDRMMLTVLYSSGARVSELIGLRRDDLVLDPVAQLRILGKGRKGRTVPLWPTTRVQLKRWLREIPLNPDTPLFPSRSGGRLARVCIAERLALAAPRATRESPELAKRRISPHVTATLGRYAPSAVRSPHDRHRALTWTCQPGHVPPIPRGRSRDEDSSSRVTTGAAHAIAPLPPQRPHACVPAGSVIIRGVRRPAPVRRTPHCERRRRSSRGATSSHMQTVHNRSPCIVPLMQGLP